MRERIFFRRKIKKCLFRIRNGFYQKGNPQVSPKSDISKLEYCNHWLLILFPSPNDHPPPPPPTPSFFLQSRHISDQLPINPTPPRTVSRSLEGILFFCLFQSWVVLSLHQSSSFPEPNWMRRVTPIYFGRSGVFRSSSKKGFFFFLPFPLIAVSDWQRK